MLIPNTNHIVDNAVNIVTKHQSVNVCANRGETYLF